MKKILILLFPLLLLLSSCEAFSESAVNAIFAVDIKLADSSSEIEDGYYYWTYTAIKKDGGMTDGQCLTEQPINVVNGTFNKGMPQGTLVLAPGIWDLTLRGYLSIDEHGNPKNLAYTSSISNQIYEHGQPVWFSLEKISCGPGLLKLPARHMHKYKVEGNDSVIIDDSFDIVYSCFNKSNGKSFSVTNIQNNEFLDMDSGEWYLVRQLKDHTTHKLLAQNTDRFSIYENVVTTPKGCMFIYNPSLPQDGGCTLPDLDDSESGPDVPSTTPTPDDNGEGIVIEIVDDLPKGHLVLDVLNVDNAVYRFTLVNDNAKFPPMSYQWAINGKPVAGATENIFDFIPTRNVIYNITCTFNGYRSSRSCTYSFFPEVVIYTS